MAQNNTGKHPVFSGDEEDIAAYDELELATVLQECLSDGAFLPTDANLTTRRDATPPPTLKRSASAAFGDDNEGERETPAGHGHARPPLRQSGRSLVPEYNSDEDIDAQWADTQDHPAWTASPRRAAATAAPVSPVLPPVSPQTQTQTQTQPERRRRRAPRAPAAPEPLKKAEAKLSTKHSATNMRKMRVDEEDLKERLRAAIDEDIFTGLGKKGLKTAKMYDAARQMIERLREKLEQLLAEKERNGQ